MELDTAEPKRGWRWSRLLWTAAFVPICIGLVIGGVLYHWIFLLACLLWIAALASVLRMETLHHKTKVSPTPAPRDQLARAGWLVLALLLIFASAGLLNGVLG